jgi:hypothetical protein
VNLPFPTWCGDTHGCHDHLHQQLTRIETKLEDMMSALTDLQAADTALKNEVAAFLTDIAGRLGTVDDASAEAVVADINAEVAALQAADTTTPPAATSGNAGVSN